MTARHVLPVLLVIAVLTAGCGGAQSVAAAERQEPAPDAPVDEVVSGFNDSPSRFTA